MSNSKTKLAQPISVNNEMAEINGRPRPQTLPILPLRGLVVYPLTAVPLNVGQPRSIKLIDDASQGNNLIGLFASHDPEVNTPGPGEIYRVGTVVVVHRLLRKSDGTIRLLVNGLYRARIKVFTSVDPYLAAEVEPLPETVVPEAVVPEAVAPEAVVPETVVPETVVPETVVTDTIVEAMTRNLVDMFLRLAEFVPSIPGDLLASSLNLEDPLQLAYTIATYIRLDLRQAQELLEINRLSEKLEWLIRHIGREIEVLEMGQRIRSEAFGQMEQAQREYFLREQLKAIQRELGEADERTIEIQEFQKKIDAAGMAEEALREAKREISRLTRLPVAAAEYGVVRTYLEWLTSLPWRKSTADNLDLKHARQVLDEDHHSLEEIKDRIIEFLAVRRLRQTRQIDDNDWSDDAALQRERTGAILCFVGPPGVGKTSLGRSIARAMGRKFARISLGGMRDEAEIRGHRRTYIGALPGRIIQTLRRIESRNPVIILDEVDKIGADFRGDPAAALLEVLDPEQNREFRDHYLDLPFDLSAVLFITTANYLDPIPGPLRDRMEVLQLAGYTESEKVAIGQQYLLPRQIRENGLRPAEIHFTTEALRAIIQEYTREAGVRNLDRQIGRVCRKVATAVASSLDIAGGQVQIVPATLGDYLGPTRYFAEISRRTQTPGVATGLSWTAAGGSILFVEAAKMPGGKGLTITGHLGDVMRESAQAALSYIRSRAGQLNIEPDFFDRHDIHIHVPAGAIPKDGPSAGITIATALASLLTGRPVRDDVGLTGEITLRGQLMPVGGLKEKVLAAHRAGLRTIILPEQNEQDLVDIPEEISQELDFILAGTIDEVLAAALAEPAA